MYVLCILIWHSVENVGGDEYALNLSIFLLQCDHLMRSETKRMDHAESHIIFTKNESKWKYGSLTSYHCNGYHAWFYFFSKRFEWKLLLFTLFLTKYLAATFMHIISRHLNIGWYQWVIFFFYWFEAAIIWKVPRWVNKQLIWIIWKRKPFHNT